MRQRMLSQREEGKGCAAILTVSPLNNQTQQLTSNAWRIDIMACSPDPIRFPNRLSHFFSMP
jgi:hypothetical protein